MRTRLALVSVAVCLLLGAHLATSQQRDFSKVEFKTVHVAGNIYMLDSGVAGNVGLSVGPDGVLMVDDQFAPLADKIRAATAAVGKGSLEFLINTHFHGDHTGGNAVFGQEATIVAHANVRKRLSQDQTGPALPVITYQQSVSVYFNGEEIEAMHFPAGHTDTDSVIFFKNSHVVHMGDHFFNGRFPFVDLNSGGSVEGYAANVGKVIEHLPADAKIIPGHGALATLDDLKQFHGMMVETIDLIRGMKQSGKSLDDAKKQGLPSKWDSWGSGFISTDRWIETVYNSLG